MAVYYTRPAKDVILKRRFGWMVCEHGTDRVIAWCPTSQDAERVKALLVFYGGHIPPSEAGAALIRERREGA